MATRRKFRRHVIIALAFTTFVCFMYINGLYYLWHPIIFIRDVGYITRPLWDSPPTEPKTIIPRFFSENLPMETICQFHNWTLRQSSKRPIVVDAVLFSNELDILEIRLRELWDVVDIFLVLEADKTYSGHTKPLFLTSNLQRFGWALDKLKVVVVRHLSEKPKGAFDNEIAMRVSAKEEINKLNLSHGDLVIESDVDEIVRADALKTVRMCEGYPNELHLQLDQYLYSFEFILPNSYNWKPRITTYDRQKFSYRHHNKGSELMLADAGWHCSFCFRYLEDFIFKMMAYSHNDRVTSKHLLKTDVIQEKICKGADIFEMLPEAYSFTELINLWGPAKRRKSTEGLPKTLLDNYIRFKFLLPGGCVRQAGNLL